MAEKRIPEGGNVKREVVTSGETKPTVNKGHVTKRIVEGKKVEKGPLEKAVGVFLAEDLNTVKGHIMDDYIAPRAADFAKDAIRKLKRFLIDSAAGMLEIALFGKSTGRDSYYDRRGDRPYSSYYYRSANGYSRDDRDRERDGEARIRSLVMPVEIPSYGKAEEVLGELIAITKKYPCASVGDYYDLVGIQPSSVDYDRGWFDLIDVKIVAGRDGYILDLPKPVPLN